MTDRSNASRLRLTALATLVIAVVMLCAGLALMTLQHRFQTDDVDETLQARSEDIEEAFDAGSMRPVLDPGDTDGWVAQVVYGQTDVLASTANMSGQRALSAPDGDVQSRSTTIAISDEPYRLLSRRINDLVVIHTATPIPQIDKADDALRTSLAFVIPAVTLLFGFLAWWLIGRRVTAASDDAAPTDAPAVAVPPTDAPPTVADVT
ncbi:MAG: hypothetical protein ABL953_03560 [Ilumatobacteraceae bacterium]